MHALGLEFGSAAQLSQRPGSVWNCLWGNALKRSPGIIRKSRVSYPGPGFLSSATWPSLPKKHYNGLNQTKPNLMPVLAKLVSLTEVVKAVGRAKRMRKILAERFLKKRENGCFRPRYGREMASFLKCLIITFLIVVFKRALGSAGNASAAGRSFNWWTEGQPFRNIMQTVPGLIFRSHGCYIL